MTEATSAPAQVLASLIALHSGELSVQLLDELQSLQACGLNTDMEDPASVSPEFIDWSLRALDAAAAAIYWWGCLPAREHRPILGLHGPDLDECVLSMTDEVRRKSALAVHMSELLPTSEADD